MKDKVDVVIVAGAPPMQHSDGGNPPSRAMTLIAGKPMIQWELDAMRRSTSISRIYAVGDAQSSSLDEVIPSTGSFIGNLIAGAALAAERGADRILLATCDIPLLTPEAIDDFASRALDIPAEFVYPIVTREHCLEKYPGLKRTYLKLREGVYTGGNIFLVSTGFLLRNKDVISQAYESRKQVLRLAGMIGWGTLVRVAIAQLAYPAAADITTLESAASRLLGGQVKAVVTAYAEIGEDVDKPEDLKSVELLLMACQPGARG